MKRLALTLLTIFVLAHSPWRLLGLTAEMFVVRPGNIRMTESNDRFWEALDLEARLSSMGWHVEYKSNLELRGQAALGLTVSSIHTIFIDEDMHWSSRYAVLGHEAGHTLQPGWVDHEQAECFAEGVATLVSHDGLREHARYLTTFKWTCLGTFAAEWSAIYHSAATLEDR